MMNTTIKKIRLSTLFIPIIGLVCLLLSCSKDPDCDNCPCPDCPYIDKLLPATGNWGDTIALVGGNFFSQSDSNVVLFNGMKASEILDASSDTLIVVVPEGATSGPVTVRSGYYLESEMIPEYTSPVFQLSEFSEIIAGSVGVQGIIDGVPGNGLLDSISSMVVAQPSGIVYFSDKVGNGSYVVRKISSGETQTLNCIFNDYQEITSMDDQIFFLFNEGTSSYIFQYLPANGCEAIPFYSNNSFEGTGQEKAFAAKKDSDQIENIFFLETFLEGSTDTIYLKRAFFGSSEMLTTFNFDLGTQSEPVVANDMEIADDGTIYISFTNPNSSFIKGIIYRCNPFFNYIPEPIYETQSGLDLTIKGLALDSDNNLYFASDHKIYRLDDSNDATVIAGDESGYDGGEGSLLNARFNSIEDIDIDPSNNLFVVDAGNFVIRKMKLNQ